ncbi:MAG: alanine racemase, partial [Anaerolineales bacterium]
QQLDVLAAAARESSRPAKIHLKVDTGMSRLGAAPELAYDMLPRLSGLENVEVEGIFTHFARADERYAPTTEWQLRRFTDLLAEIESAGLRPSIAHAANSAAALTRPGANFDMVRVGIALYGLAPSAEVELLEGMHPALSWHARLSHINVYPQGSGISYGHLYTTQGNERIGVVPVGYGDGYRREQGNIVLVHGRRVPVVGRVCAGHQGAGLAQGHRDGVQALLLVEVLILQAVEHVEAGHLRLSICGVFFYFWYLFRIVGMRYSSKA